MGGLHMQRQCSTPHLKHAPPPPLLQCPFDRDPSHDPLDLERHSGGIPVCANSPPTECVGLQSGVSTPLCLVRGVAVRL